MEWIVGFTSGLTSGLVSAALVSWVFYRLSGRDLAREAEDLRKLNIMTIKALVEAGIADVNFDVNGKPIGLRYKLRADAGTLNLSGSAVTFEVRRHPKSS